MAREDYILTEAAMYVSTNWETNTPNVLIETFKKGAEWADKNQPSPWINVNDDLPCNHEELTLLYCTKKVLVMTDKGCIDLLRMKKIDRYITGVKPWWDWETLDKICYWMPIPELQKK